MKDPQNQRPWSSIERRCLSLLQKTKTRATLLQIHAFMLRNALETNVNLLTKFITICSTPVFNRTAESPTSLAGTCYARKVFDQRPQRDDCILCSSMIKIHVGMHQFTESITLYRDLRRTAGFSPDDYTFTSLVKSCGVRFAVWEGEEVHNHVLKSGFCFDEFVATALVDMYAKFGEILCARRVFDDMTERSQVAWTALLVGYARCGDMGNARLIFDQMPLKDVVASNAMINEYVKLGDMSSARILFDGMVDRNVVSWSTMLHGYCNVGDIGLARSLFEAMPVKNLVTWNTMISGCFQNKKPQEAINLFHELRSSTRFEPDEATITSVLPAIAVLGALDLGNWVHCFVQRKRLDRAPNICTALVDMYAKCGEIGKARRVFEEMPQKETPVWNAMINGLAINGYAEEAISAFSNMMRAGFKPNEITFVAVLSACIHGGLVEEGMKWFEAMHRFGVTPKIEHYGCMVDLLGRAGCLDEAEQLIESMPYEANAIILSSLLCACRYFKDVGRAVRVMKKAIELEPSNEGNYVCLRNLYATERRWENVEAINCSNKEVGCSAI